MDSRQILDCALKELAACGVRQGEVFLLDSRGVELSVNEGQVEELKQAEERGLGVRIFQEGRLGFAYTARVTPEGLERAIQEALANSRHTTPEEANALPDDVGEPREAKTFDERQEAIPLAEKIAFAQEIEREARGRDARITKFRESAYRDRVGEIFIANTEGLERSSRFSRVVGYTLPVAEEDGEAEFGYEVDHGLSLMELSAAEIGKRAAEKALDKLGAKGFPTQRATLVLDPEVAAELMQALAPAFYADNLLKGKSLFAGRLGEAVAGPAVALVDDGALDGGGQCAPFDGEGVASGETVLIAEGKLRSFLHSSYTARRMGLCSTGNAVRGSYQALPQVGSTNIYLKPGTMSRGALLAGVSQGLYISEVMGVHTVNPISGDYSLGARARVIRGGELAEAVKGIAIAGNILELLRAVRAVADDLRLFSSGAGGCTVLLEGISVSGR